MKLVLRAVSTLLFSALASRSMAPSSNDNNNNNKVSSSTSDTRMKHRVLCLHGRCQSGAMLSNKIAGARKKFQRLYELDFLDGPLVVVAADADRTATTNGNPKEQQQQQQSQPSQQLAWWERDSKTGRHVRVNEAFTYVMEEIDGRDYDAIIGFSQGGVLGASLVLTGAFPNVKAVLTAGSPFVQDAFECAKSLAPDQETIRSGLEIPKLHFAGLTDAMVPVDSTRRLCDEAGNGRVVTHEKGHLFPTKADYVNQMMQFLEDALRPEVVDQN